jgi:hypothetical protein
MGTASSESGPHSVLFFPSWLKAKCEVLQQRTISAETVNNDRAGRPTHSSVLYTRACKLVLDIPYLEDNHIYTTIAHGARSTRGPVA